MTEKEKELIEEQRKRRKRIARMKSTIIFSIAGWMVVSFVCIIVLFVMLVNLNSKVNKYEKLLTNIEESTEPEAKQDNSDVVTGIDTDDNFFSEGDQRKVYLTFDCVPGDNTNQILDQLAAKNVKATFFVSGDDSGASDTIYKRIVDEGHTIGLHSFSNTYSDIYGSKESFINDLNKIHDYIYNVTGVDCRLYRFPNGSRNEISDVDMIELVSYLNSKGYIYYDWNVSAGDAASEYTSDSLISNVINGITNYKTSVVLLHDDSNKSTTVETIAPLIDAINEMDAEILPIDEDTYVVQYIKADSVK